MNQEARKLWNKIFTIFSFTSCYLLLASYSYADTSQGNDYIFHMQINSDTNDQNAPYNQTGKYIINHSKPKTEVITPTPAISTPAKPPQTSIAIGYDSQAPTNDLRFSIADDIVDYGPLSPTDFITRDSLLTISGDPSYIYSIVGYENHPLQNDKGQIIPDTRCDDGNCSETKASDWTDTLTFGFGYRCNNIDGSSCEENFNAQSAYKPFIQNDGNQNGATVAKGTVNSGEKTKVIYKINVPGTQPQGTYQNEITYLAVPSY